MEFSYQKLNNDNISLVENKQLVVDCRISELVDENVSKIICLDASSKVDSFDLSNGEVLVKGKINYRLVYLDNLGEVRSINYLCDYEDNILSNNLNSTDKIIPCSEVKSVSSSGLDIIRLSAVLMLKVYKVVNNEYETVCDDSEDCYYQKQTINKMDFVTSTVTSFDVEDEIAVKEPVKDILMLDAEAILSGSTCKENKIIIDGEAKINVTYRTESEIKTEQLNVPFTEEVEGASSLDSFSYTKLNVDSSKIVLKEDDKLLKVKLIINAKSAIFKPSSLEVVSDMYSMTNEVNCVKQKGYVDSLCEYKNYDDNCLVEATLKESFEGKIIDVICPKNRVASCKVENGEIVVDGVLSACLLYEKDDKICSINIESMYRSNLQDFDYDNCFVEGYVTAITARVKSDNIICLDAQLKFNVICQKRTNFCYVSSLEDLGELKVNKSAINIVVVGENKSFFDVAKSLATTPEQLIEQNPNLTEPLAVNDKVYFYRQLEKKYDNE